MRLISAILAAAAAAVMAADPEANTAEAGLEEQLLRFEAMTAKQGLSVFKYPHLAPAAASLASLPESIASPVKAMLTTCGPDVEQLCQVTFGASIPSDKARGTAMLTALDCLHDRFPQVTTECVHAAHTAAEAIAAGGFEAQQEVLAAKADAALRSAAAACDAGAVQAACPAASTTSTTPTTPKQQPGAPEGGKPGRDPGMRPNRPGWRLLRWGSHTPHHGPPSRSGEPLPPPPAAKAWFLAHSQASAEDVQALGTTMEDVAACALALAGPPPPAASWLPWHQSHPAQPAADTGDACKDSARTWLATAAHGARSASLSDAASHESAAVVSLRSAAPLSGSMRADDWAVPGMQGDQGAPGPGGPPTDHPRHHWRHPGDDDEHDDDVGDILFSLLMLALVSACVLRCACRARRRHCRRNRDEPHPFAQREAHQRSVPTPQEAAAAAAVAASAPSSSAPQYFYGASAAPPPPAAQTVQQGMYPDVPPAPSRWSLASVMNMGGGPGAGYAPVRTMEH